MASQKYSYIIAKIILCFGRVIGITFGGVHITPNLNPILKYPNNKAFETSISKRWKLFGFLVFPFYLAYAINRLVFIVKRFQMKQEMDTIIRIVFAAGSTLFALHCCAIYVTCHFFGKEIFDFLSFQKITKKQFRLCLLVLFLPLLYIFCLDSAELTESALKYNSIVVLKKAINCIAIKGFDIAWTLGIGIRVLVSIMAYWNVNSMIANLNNKSVSRQTLDNTLVQICKEFSFLKNSIERLNSIFAIPILTDFSMNVAFVLMDIPVILNERKMSALFQSFCNLMSFVILCWVHGLPHKACRDLIHALDNVTTQMPSQRAQKTNRILSRSTVGFKILGYNYDFGLLPSVKILFLIYNVFIL